MIGDTGVGKSSILLQFMQGKFREGHEITIGVEFGSKTIQIDNQDIKLQIWDTAGQEDFRSLTRGYYRNTAGAIIVYDITRRETFENVIQWIEEAKNNGNQEMMFILIGNKMDLESQRMVSKEEGQQLALKHDMLFLETSAKQNVQIQEIFTESTQQILNKVEEKVIDPTNSTYGIRVGNQANAMKLENKSAQQSEGYGCC
ncbi:P-loop containing nucleoside triphosphate hydrolase [Pseudocohnilembus persalinus]|uniref:p-loop containing nucleoside triphosphate hydrolase n=1 Tax=Pseudocohnilembus persalinus TaxID=266149 RepID=A0A0V0R1Z6_PSEPJ|nr:P-loop containing nucleoside triphosphate hydrolase [Pseudocohnilembus persalinus]|eukprot:KRX08413.1 P-loop containing nucleoside triphosphate hydrolase [Pseudocohnilembus persalinus]